jgi:hypothetical protein
LSAYEKAVAHYRFLLDRFNQSIQEIEVELQRLEKEKGRVTVPISGGSEAWSASPLLFLMDRPAVEWVSARQGIEELKGLLATTGSTHFDGGAKELKEFENLLNGTLTRLRAEELGQRKRNLEELLVKSSLGIARNLSPKDLGVGRE